MHERLFDDGAVHFLARRDGDDVGLLTVEFSSPAPRLCPQGQPYIGPTVTHPEARNSGIGSTRSCRSGLGKAQQVDETVSVDFDSANPLSRPFWLGLGFQPTGYRLRRAIDVRHQRVPSFALPQRLTRNVFGVEPTIAPLGRVEDEPGRLPACRSRRMMSITRRRQDPTRCPGSRLLAYPQPRL